MRRLIALTIAAAIAVGGALLPAAPALADVDDFTFESFSGDYSLDRDADGHSTVTTVETLVALFPDADQNRGIRRNLNADYDGHPTELTIVSVTDGDGRERAYEEDSDDGVVSLTIAGDEYVHGRQTYVITYTEKYLDRYYADTDAQEFYRDTNGTDWAQPFGQVTATVHLSDELLEARTGNADAASGAEGENGPAEITETADGYEFAASDVGPHENLTFSIGFENGTFTPRDDGFTAAPWPTLALVFTMLAVLAMIGAFVVRSTRLRDAPGRGTIVAEYLPPRGVGVALAGVILGKSTTVPPAQILALAVAGRVRIVEVADPRGRGKDSYELEFVQTGATGREAYRHPEPSAEDLEVLHAIFGAELTPGERRPLGKADSKALKRLTAAGKRVRADAVTDGYRRRFPTRPVTLVVLGAIVAGVLAVLFSAISLATVYGGFWPGVFLGVAVAAMIAACVAVAKYPLDAKGVEARDHLRGLDEYIRLAEADRIRYLQSPQGAERTPVATDDREQMLDLTERLLPWAVLLGHEKKWTAELGRYYEEIGAQPGWYVGSHPFNAALFATSISSVSSSVTSSYSASSGGSTGGASSGGGSGGGGGGGV
ncbi:MULTISPECIES: DUF2207 domain-containing protein [unclassified Leifsonia]|uniref:DUF2207 domain-containing protein n=1 Tax=unclassified Leifsonia TaxID=2663824 RepID=UPI000A595919|nr:MULTISPECIES: DUF2207 domain-containing protein [unclassified Leifsonia]